MHNGQEKDIDAQCNRRSYLRSSNSDVRTVCGDLDLSLQLAPSWT